MSIFQAIILGIVQGFAEFLPISSSGHLVLFQKLFGMQQEMFTFDVMLHIATLIPIFIVYKEELFALIKKPFQKTTYLLVIATIPAVVITLLFGDVIEVLFEGTVVLALCFIFTGVILIFSDKLSKGNKKIEDVTYLDALLIGCMQGIAIPPGISRSGSTIFGALSRKLNRETAAKFSFLMSIPAIAGAATLQIKDILTGAISTEHFELIPYSLAFVSAAISGYISIRFMIALIQKCKLKYFSYYVFVLAFLILGDHFITKMFF